MRCEPVSSEPSDHLACVACGCTNARACAGGCWWVSLKPPKCSSCFDEDGVPFAVGDTVDEAFGIELCPASDVPAPHAKLFASESLCYCARCGTGLAA